MKRKRKGISFVKDEQNPIELFQQFYLGFRSSLFICEDGVDEEYGRKLLRTWCELCVPKAVDYTLKHMHSNISLPVDFMWIIRTAIINIVKKNILLPQKYLSN